MSLTAFIGTSPRSEGVRGWLERHGANMWLACCLLGFLAISIFFVPFGSTRYTLPCMPPLFLLVGIFCARHLPARASVTAAGVSAIIGLMCAEADRRAAQVPPLFASMYKDHNTYEEEIQGSKTWIHGELSFRWFLEREAELEVIASDSNDPKPGDRILRSEACTPASIFGREGTYLLHEDLSSRLQSLKTQDFEDPWPVRVHNGSAGAGFYAYTGGGLPYAFSSIRLDQIGVLAVLREPLLLGDPEDMPILATAPAIMLEGAPMEGQASIEALSLDDGQPQTDSILFLRPGLASWPSVLIPDNCLLQTRVLEGEECWRLNGDDPMPGPGAIFRMYANDVLVAEIGLDSRRDSEQEGWKTLNADLSRWSQQEISLSFEVAAWQPPADLDEANADMCAGIIAGPELTWP